MKKRVKHIAVVQFGKMLATVYFVAMLPLLAILLLAILTGVEMPPIGAGVGILVAIVYIVSIYLAGMLSAWIYNIVAARLGGGASNTRSTKSLHQRNKRQHCRVNKLGSESNCLTTLRNCPINLL